jgi:beta-lactamase regulating signal transducer with metallopeptidase domain
MRKILGVVVAAFVAVLTVGAVAASAAGTAKYTGRVRQRGV